MSDVDTANTSASWVAAMAASLEDDNCGPAARLLRALLAERDAAQAEAKRLRELLRDVTDALEPHVPTNAKHREPYEHPLSAYDRARDALARAAKAERDRAEVEAYYGQAKREVAEAEAKAARLRAVLERIAYTWSKHPAGQDAKAVLEGRIHG